MGITVSAPGKELTREDLTRLGEELTRKEKRANEFRGGTVMGSPGTKSRYLILDRVSLQKLVQRGLSEQTVYWVFFDPDGRSDGQVVGCERGGFVGFSRVEDL